MTNLGSKALLVSMHATCWSAKKVDADVSRSATDAYGADAEAGRFLKNLIQNEHGGSEEIAAPGAWHAHDADHALG